MVSELPSVRFRELLGSVATEYDRLVADNTRLAMENARLVGLTGGGTGGSSGPSDKDAALTPQEPSLALQPANLLPGIGASDSLHSTAISDSVPLSRGPSQRRFSRQRTQLSPAVQDFVDGRKKVRELFKLREASVKVSPVWDVEMYSKFLGELAQGHRMHQLRLYCHKALSSDYFDRVMGGIIVLNSATIGLETAWSNDDVPWPFDAAEHVFLSIYLLEISARGFAHGSKCLQSRWVRFDFVLVGAGVLHAWIGVPVRHMMEIEGGVMTEIGNSLMVFRLLRLFRIARAFRLLVQFKTLWMLVRGMMGSVDQILSTSVLMFLMLYIFAVLGYEVINNSPANATDEQFKQLCENHFPSLAYTMLTLIQFVTCDSIAAIYDPMIRADWRLFFYFVPFILIVSIALMNLVTAVIVEGAIAQGQSDKELIKKYRQKELEDSFPQFVKLFEELEVGNADGFLTLEILERAPEQIQVELKRYMHVDSLLELFEVLDEDGSGEVDRLEFIERLSAWVINQASLENIQNQKTLSHLKDNNRTIKQVLDKMMQNMQIVISRIDSIAEEVEKKRADREAKLSRRGEGWTRTGL